MSNTRKPTAIRWIALLLLLAHLFMLAGCGTEAPDTEGTGNPTQPTDPADSETHVHAFTDGVCQCGESNGLNGFTVQTDAALTAVVREDTDSGMTLTSANAAGEMQAIRLEKEIDTVYGHYYEIVYKFTSNVAGTVRFVSDDVAYYESNEYEVAAGENEIAVRFAAGEGDKANTSLELGGLDKFSLTFTAVTCEELQADLSAYFLDVAPEKASGSMETTGDGHLAATYRTDEGWRVKLAVDRTLVKGKTYETTFVFTKSGGKDQNVTYTVYDGAATVIGSKTKWVDSDLCVATFYFTANESVTKGTCLELGQLCGGEDVSLTFTYIDFEEVDAEKLEKLLAANPFPGVNVWTEAALNPAMGTQSADGLKLVNTNPATDWWKVKLEQDLPADKGGYYRVTFQFTSDAAGRIKFVNDNATYYGANEYDVKKGDNTFAVELKSGGNSYSCLELGGLGPCELNFTEIQVEKIDKPQNSQQPGPGTQSPAVRFGSFRVWNDGSVQKLKRSDTATTMTLTSQNEPTDWWKVKLEKDINGKTGQWYELVYTFTSDTTGRIKFVNDDAIYFGSNEYDVVEGENTFAVKFKYGGKPYSCLELGGLGQFKLVFTNYTLQKIEEPEIVTNGFEGYQAWTEGSMKPLTREDTETAMTLISENPAGDWWKVKLENGFKAETGKTYEVVYQFTSNVEGDIKFGTNEKVTCLTDDVYHVTVGENRFAVTFTAEDGAYTCLELGGLGEFQLVFTDISLAEAQNTEQPEEPEEHTHSFVNGVCECGANNGFAGVSTWTEGSLVPVVREDTENAMILTSTNASGDWWKVKLEWPLNVVEGKTYEAAFTFTSDAAGMIKYSVNGATFLDSQDYNVVAGANTFKVHFTAGAENYSCLELGGLGAFKLTFTGVSLAEVDAPHTHSFVNGKCDCGAGNGFAGVSTWTEGSLVPVVREDTENAMILTSTNASGDWWKVKLEWPLNVVEGKTYEAAFTFTSDAAGMIKYSVNGATFLDSQDYNVVAGTNTFKVRFTAGAENYSCLELGGLGAFKLTFTGVSLTEVDAPHTHSFVNGKCECGAGNGFAGVSTWTEGSLVPVVREDTENAMILTSANASGDWWKVKLEWLLNVVEGKTYEATFVFTSNASGMIKYSVNGATFLDSQDYNVVAGTNTFKVRFTAGAENYSCLELGGLGNFKLTFLGVSLKEV